MMDADHHLWRVWANGLQRWGLQELVASVLEAFGPLSLLGAQIVYLGQPLLNQTVSASHMEAFAHMLENRDETQAFVAMLREGVQR